MILEIFSIVVVCLLVLLFFWLYYRLLVAVVKEIHPDMNYILWDLSEWNESLIQFELWKTINKQQNEEDQKLINHSAGLLNSTQQEQYDAYRKRGGTDSESAWLQKSDLDELFP